MGRESTGRFGWKTDISRATSALTILSKFMAGMNEQHTIEVRPQTVSTPKKPKPTGLTPMKKKPSNKK